MLKKLAVLILGLLAACVVIAFWAYSPKLLPIIFGAGLSGVGAEAIFESVSALFSGLAFVGLFLAVIYQSLQLRLQRQELLEARQKLEEQRLQMQAQNDMLKQQAFENTFFQLLKLHSEILAAVEIREERMGQVVPIRGRECFPTFYRKFCELFSATGKVRSYPAPELKIADAYKAFYAQYQADLGHYFRSLYYIVKLVHKSDIANRRLYTNLVRAQLSSAELLLLFYNCLSTYGNQKFKPLVEEYSLLKNVPKEQLIDGQDVMFYTVGAVGQS